MLSGVTFSASEIAGTAVFRIVVSSDSMKNATATSHGKSRLLEADGAAGSEGVWPEGEEVDGLDGMESKNYFTNEYGNLLKYIATPRIVPSIVLACFYGDLARGSSLSIVQKRAPKPFRLPLSCYDKKT